jgi:hypothetical protein
VALEGIAQDLLRAAPSLGIARVGVVHAVLVGHVEKGDAGVDCLAHHSEAGGFVARGGAELVAAEADHRR